MNFGQALEVLKTGGKVARSGWNGRGMFLYYVPPGAYPSRTEAAKGFFGADSLVPYRGYIAIKTVDDYVVPWVAAQSDLIEDDWLSV